MAYATLTDVSTRLGRPITDPFEAEQVAAWLADVETLILGRYADLTVRVDAGTPTPALVAMVEANAVIRKIRNPDGKIEEQGDDYRYRLNPDAGRGDLFLTAEEWALLAPGGAPGDGAFTIRPVGDTRGPGAWLHGDVWVPSP